MGEKMTGLPTIYPVGQEVWVVNHVSCTVVTSHVRSVSIYMNSRETTISYLIDEAEQQKLLGPIDSACVFGDFETADAFRAQVLAERRRSFGAQNADKS